MRITYTEINGRRYAYACTSERVPGRKNPVSRRTYLGIVDPGTGEIIPKKGFSEADLLIGRMLDIKSYGDVAVVMSVIKRLNLLDDLEEVFGDRGLRILAIAMAQAIRPSSSDYVDRTLKESYIRECLGAGAETINSKWVADVLNSFSRIDSERFFRNRVGQDDNRIFLLPIVASLSKGFGDFLRMLYSSTKSDDVAVVVAMDGEGKPIGFDLMNNPSLDPSDVIKLMLHMKESGYRPILVSDTTSSSTLRLADFIVNDLDFIIPFPASSVQYVSMSSAFGVPFDDMEHHREDGSIVKETQVGILMEHGAYRGVYDSDQRFSKCGVRLQAFMSYSPHINSDIIRFVNDSINSIKLRLNGQFSSDPETSLRNEAGGLVNLLKVSTDRHGLMKVTVSRDAMSKFRRNAGCSLVLATGFSWDEISFVRSMRKGLLDTLHQFYKGSRWVAVFKGANVNLYNQMFIEFLVVIIYSEIQTVLRSEGIRDEVGDALYLASSLKLVAVPSGIILNSVDRRAKRILDAFGVDTSTVPEMVTEPRADEQIE